MRFARSCTSISCWCYACLLFHGGSVSAQEGGGQSPYTTELAPFSVQTALGLHDEPALGLAMPVTRLRFVPGVDLQTRGYAELQSDLTVRGSTFEQTGVVLGAVPLYDPQTGHYTTELPFGGEMLRPGRLLVGAENARRGFNANVASIAFQWAPIEPQGRAVAGFGTDNLYFGELYQGVGIGQSGWAWDLSVGHGQGDGTVEGGDFRVWRGAARLQFRTEGTQTDFALGWLDKSYGWPGMYTGYASLLETDDYQNLIAVANHRQELDGDGFWQIGAVFRQMDDDYYFNRRTPPEERSSLFQHLTRSTGVGGDLRWPMGDHWAVLGRAVVLRDELVRSTSLTGGDDVTGNRFAERDYAKAAGSIEVTWGESGMARHRLEIGLSGSTTSEDTGRLSPVVRWQRTTLVGSGEFGLFADYSESSQVPGYTALRSAPAGLFGGNPNLGRELSRVAEAGIDWDSDGFRARASIFFRDEADLVDWTYAEATPTARQANALDLETWGAEFEADWRTRWGQLRFGYAWLEKEADYAAENIDGSFYALNFPLHRVTGGFAWEVFDTLEISAEVEFRVAEANPRRTSGDESVWISTAVRWRPWGRERLEFNLLVDNLLDDDFEDFPGTPAAGRHGSLRALYAW